MPLEDKIKNIRKYAVIYSAGGIGALAALRMDLLTFPPVVRLNLSYAFSTITIICIFLGGTHSVLEMLRKAGSIIKKLNEIDDEEKNKPEI